MKSLLLLLPLTVLLASCASVMPAQQVADYDGDGLISDAEQKQFNKQAQVQERNVYTQGVKRRDVANTVRDANDIVWGSRSIVRGIENF